MNKDALGSSLKTISLHARKSFVQYWQLYLLILPTIVYLWLFSYVPMYGVQIAFRKFSAKKGILGSPWVGLYYFDKFLHYPDFGKIVVNTLRVTLLSLLTFPTSIILALSINEVRSTRFKKTVQMTTYAPHFISTVVVCSIIRLFLDRNSGIINNIVALFGGERVAYMGIPEAFAPIYVISGVWQHIGWDSIIYISALSGISPELVEAARIDGASRLQIMWHINFQCILPTVMILLIMQCGSIMSLGFEKVYLLQNSLNLKSSQVISTYVYQLGLLNGEMSYSAAILRQGNHDRFTKGLNPSAPFCAGNRRRSYHEEIALGPVGTHARSGLHKRACDEHGLSRLYLLADSRS